MNVFLWILQILLSFHTAMGAVWKLSHSEQAVPSLSAMPHAAWLAMSVVEMLCAVALLAPAVIKRLRILVPIATAYIIAEMLLFSVVHLASGTMGHGQMLYWLVVAAISGFLLYGRLVLRPLQRALALLVMIVGFGAEPVEAKTLVESTPVNNRQLVRRLYEECINPNKLDMLSRFVSDDYVGPRGDKGPSAYAATVTSLRQGFPDVRFSVEDLVAEGDRVAIRWKWQGTHTGTFSGIPASARPVRNEGIVIYQIKAGKIARNWLQVDRLGVLQQIGLIPNDVTTLAMSSAMRETRHLGVFINRPAQEVYDFVSKPENLPQWATGLGGSIQKVKGEWIADSPMGKVKIRMAKKNSLGVLDHVVVLATGETITNPMRVVPKGTGSEASFTLFRRPEMTDAKFSQDAQWVEKDLNILKGLLEKQGGTP